ncbi:MAG: TonB-dependent receptor [Verrucomicrobiaceae bacterium]|nr:TonB-dependent receptor [Verrucomicrobiaceae bacterium]
MHSFHKSLISISVLATTSLAFTPSVHAQAQPADTRVKIDEVQVTARREAESIQSVPVSVVAFGEEALRQKNITNAEDIQTITPGVFLSGSGGRQNTIYSIRGQSKALSGPSSPAVIPYFAEVPEINFGSAVTEYDLASVQVLKGPQGTLFGRNTLGGAVLYTPNAPSYKFGGDLSVSVGNYNNREFKGAVNVPIIDDKLAIRLAGDVQRRDGWAKDVGTGKDLENIDTKAVRLSVLWDPVEGISNLLIADYYKAKDNGFESYLRSFDPTALVPSLFGVGSGLAAGYATQQSLGLYKVKYSVPQFTKNERSGITDKLSIQLTPGYEVINIFGYRNSSLKYNTNVDGIGNIQTVAADALLNNPAVGAPGLVPDGIPVKFLLGDLYDNTHQYSDELQLRGLSFDDKLDWLVGAFYLKSKPSGVGGNLVSFTAPVDPADAAGAVANGISGYNFTTQTSKAGFFNGKYDLGQFAPGVKFNAGMRYTKDETESCTGSAPYSGLYDLGDCNDGVGLANAATIKSKSNSTTWNVGFDWQIDPDLFTYITARKGYRAGGANGPTLAPGPLAKYQTFKPDTVTDVEVGIRSDLHFGDALLRSNVSVFSGWYEDVQVVLSGITGFSPGPAGGTMLINAGKTRVQGVDFAFTLAPDEHWTFDFGGSFLRLDTLDYSVDPLLQVYVGSTTELPFNLAAKKSFTSAVRYEFPVPRNMGEMAFNLNYYFNGEMPVSTQMIPAYGIFNGRIDWTHVAQTGFDLSLFAKNLGDKKYLSGGVAASPTLGIETALVGAPRIYGVEARYRF